MLPRDLPKGHRLREISAFAEHQIETSSFVTVLVGEVWSVPECRVVEYIEGSQLGVQNVQRDCTNYSLAWEKGWDKILQLG